MSSSAYHGPRRTTMAEAEPGPNPKTSAAAVFALVFGLAALFCALTAILSPPAILFGIIALILGVVGISKSGRPHVTGRGVAIGGLVTGLLGLLLGGAIVIGAATFLTDKGNVNRLEQQVQKLKDKLPSQVPTPTP